MLLAVLQYTDGNPTTAFLALKQNYISDRIWLLAFYIHISASIFCLAAGFTQFSVGLRNQIPKIHRWVGKIYVFSILFINFPSGFILALNANGGWTGKSAFTLLSILWFWFTLKAWLEIRKGNISSHQKFMIRSYALTLSAISLRLWKLAFLEMTDWDEALIYQIDAWLGFGVNWIIAELIIRWKFQR